MMKQILPQVSSQIFLNQKVNKLFPPFNKMYFHTYFVFLILQGFSPSQLQQIEKPLETLLSFLRKAAKSVLIETFSQIHNETQSSKRAGMKLTSMALSKLDNLKIVHGFPTELFPTDGNVQIDKSYSSLKVVKSHSLLENFVSVLEFKREEKLQDVLQSFITKDIPYKWHFQDILIDNAVYRSDYNLVELPLGFLLEEITEMPKNMESWVKFFGRAGSLIGHEIVHMVDPMNIHFDGNGWLRSGRKYKASAHLLHGVFTNYIKEFEAFVNTEKSNRNKNEVEFDSDGSYQNFTLPERLWRETFTDILGLKIAKRAMELWKAEEMKNDQQGTK